MTIVGHKVLWNPEHYFKNSATQFGHATGQKLLNESGLSRFKAEFTIEEQISYESLAVFTNFIKGWLPHLNILQNIMMNFYHYLLPII